MTLKFAPICAAAIAAFCPLFGKDVYVSSSAGDDKNDGSISAPLRTIAAAPKDGVNVFLKRGDVFFEPLEGFKNSKIDAYGKGKKPLLCGLKILKNNGAWEKLPDGVWRLDLTKQQNFGGYKAYGVQNNIGAVYDTENDRIYGCLTRTYKGMRDPADFWVSDADANEVKPKDNKFTHLFFKCKTHPSELAGKIAFLPYNFGIRGIRNCTVQNIAVKGFGAHGISRAWNSKFVNIDIDLIGGSLLRSYKTWVRFGNGIEFWMDEKNPCNDNLVEGCTISRTFDCGSTIQGNLGKNSRPKNIVFRGNKFLRCRQAFEHFLTAKKSAAYANCEFSDNKCFDMGENEFSTPESRDANLLSYERNPIEGLSIGNNIFWGAPVYALHSYPAKLENNTFYVYRGQYLRHNRGKPEETIWADSEADVEKFKSAVGDASDKFVIVERSDTQLRREVLESVFAPQKEKIERKTREKYRRDSFFRK